MAEIMSITLHNFKGAEKVTLDFSTRIESPVITLIGLNESGKTTILEGLSYFVTGDSAVSSIFQGIHSKSATNALIPVHRKAAFTGEIKISAIVRLDEADFDTASTLAGRQRLSLVQGSFPKDIEVARIYTFEDSILKDSSNIWDLTFNVRGPRGRKEREYVRPTTNDDSGRAEPDLWAATARAIENRLPRIAYFPTFLVDMPAKIYLREHKDERAVNRYYRSVFQDILDSLAEGLSLEKHVCKRIEDFESKTDSPNWFSIFFGSPSKAPIDSVFQKISSAVTREVLGSWRKVFQRAIAAKSISIDWNVDTEKDNLPYASFFVSDGESRYAISERSLGFRWFFSFLLFTAFRQASTRSTLFVFDEPAANLHAKAQAELLKSFSRIVSGGNRVVYSTHSHHMINPQWLSGAYIVENTALDHDADDAFGLTTQPTNILVTRYRSFVSQYPNRTSYFQPVIEKLEYVTPEIVGSPPFIIVEGISDFYALKLVHNKSKNAKSFSLMPGGGASASGPLISLLLGRAERFLILLDDDTSGRKAAQRYRDEWFLPQSSVMTLADLDEHYRGRRLEGLVSSETKELIQKRLGTKSAPSKKQIGLYFAEMCAVGNSHDFLSEDTKKNLLHVLDLASQKASK